MWGTGMQAARIQFAQHANLWVRAGDTYPKRLSAREASELVAEIEGDIDHSRSLSENPFDIAASISH